MALWPNPPFRETAVALGANDTFNGVQYQTLGYEYFRVLAAADQEGTVNIQYSHDGYTWWTSTSEDIVPWEATIIESMCCSRYVRVSVTNGDTPQTQLLVNSCMRTGR